MKKNYIRLFLATVAVCLLTSCSSPKNVTYFQNRETLDKAVRGYLVDARIMPKDVLTITVSTTTPEAAKQFNLVTPTSQTQLQTYLVDNEGMINFPVIGQVHVGGLTKSQAEKTILEKIKPFMAAAENPIVTVRMTGYQISVIGEVAHPGTFTVSREKISILEALAQAGDLTIYGQRKNVQLIREDSTGMKSIHYFDLTDANIINSPYFYLQQNDVVNVTPNKAKAQNSSVGSMTTLWFSATSILISLTSLLYNILKN